MENEKAYWISEVAELTAMNVNTIRKYCLLLENHGHHFIRDEQDRRAFRSPDIILLQEMKKIQKNEKVTVEEAAKLAVGRSGRGLHPNSVMPVMRSITLKNDIDNNIILALQNEIVDLRSTLQFFADKFQEIHSSSFSQQREQKITDWITRKRIESQLEEAALKEWGKLSDHERLKKVGWFKREEDRDKRDRFIKKYIMEQYEQALRKELE